jgi:tetratricopeptide (TPR) repeat protein
MTNPRDTWYVGRKTAVVLILSVVTVLVSRTTVFASTSQLKEGNRQFKNGNYDKASELYQDALIDTPYSSILQFNLGDALAMKSDMPKAEVAFTEAAKSANPVLKGASHYNRGNVLFAQGKWADAVDAYKDSLRANPHDEDAKYNLGVALRAQKNPPASAKATAGKPSSKGSGKDNGKEQKSGSPAEASAKAGQMSREDAERLLSAAGAGEKKKSQQKATKNEVPHPDEDW